MILVLQEFYQIVAKKNQLRSIENNNIKKLWLVRILNSEFQENKNSKKTLARFLSQTKNKGKIRNVICQKSFNQDGTELLKLFYWISIIIKVQICGVSVVF